MSPVLTVPSLMKWGVSPHADLVYRTLIAFGPRPVHYISQSLELKSRQVRTALDELISLGAAAPVDSAAGDDRTWVSHAPTQVIALLRERHQRSAVARHRLQLRLTRMAHPSMIGDPGRLPRDQVRQHDGIERTRERMFAALEQVRHETMSMSPEQAFKTAQLKASAQSFRKGSARGVVRFNLGVPPSADDESAWYAAESAARGGTYRQLPTVPMKLFVFDRRSVWVPINPSNYGQGYWEITAAQPVRDLTVLFQQHWAMAKPRLEWMPPAHLAPRESAIVALLAEGHTDAVIASRLDVSVRTIAYTLSGLMERYQVTNRFQLGLRLGAEAARPVNDDGPDKTPGRGPAEE